MTEGRYMVNGISIIYHYDYLRKNNLVTSTYNFHGFSVGRNI